MTPALQASNTPEKQLLVLCTRTRIGPETAAEIGQILAGPLDWGYLISESLENSVTPLFYRQLRSVAWGLVPVERQDKLNTIAKSLAVRAMFLTAELLRLLDLFEAQGIRAIPYKGPVLAAQAYGDFALREFEGLDLILRQRDMPAANEVVLGLGYKPKFDWIFSEAAAATLVPGEYNYRDVARNAMIELHTEKTLRHFPVAPDIETFLQRLVPVRIAERDVMTFAPEELLTMLCIHGSKDFWERLSWIADVSELTQSRANFDWSRAWGFADALKAGRMVRLGLALSVALFATPLPQEVIATIRADVTASDLAESVARRLVQQPFHTLNGAGRFNFRRKMQAGAAAGWRYATRLAVVPAEEDWEMVRLPPALAPLYVALRPIRLLRKYGWGSRKD
ncbi:MAG: nucleotidyltransferase family protein [Candidatus Acidiferrales bacterium]